MFALFRPAGTLAPLQPRNDSYQPTTESTNTSHGAVADGARASKQFKFPKESPPQVLPKERLHTEIVRKWPSRPTVHPSGCNNMVSTRLFIMQHLVGARGGMLAPSRRRGGWSPSRTPLWVLHRVGQKI